MKLIIMKPVFITLSSDDFGETDINASNILFICRKSNPKKNIEFGTCIKLINGMELFVRASSTDVIKKIKEASQ